MLDLMTLAASCGLQEELEKIRKDQGESPFEHESAEQAPSTTLADAAETLSTGISAVEACVSSAVGSMIPSYEMIEGAMPTSIPTLTVDLTLPTTRCAQK